MSHAALRRRWHGPAPGRYADRARFPGAHGPKIGDLEVKAYTGIPKTKTAVQLTSDSALARNLRREVMIRLARRGNEVGFSGGNVMRMDVQYTSTCWVTAASRAARSAASDQNFDGPAANPRPEVPGIPHRPARPARPAAGRRLRITLTLYSTSMAARCCGPRRRPATPRPAAPRTPAPLMIDSIFNDADKNRIGDAGCPL